MRKIYLFFGIVFIFLYLIFIKQHTLLDHQNRIYVSENGNDSGNGSKNNPYKTIQKALDISKPGTIIEVLPGTYRESIDFTNSGSVSNPIILYVNPKNRGKVILQGTEPSISHKWLNCSDNTCTGISDIIKNKVYYTYIVANDPPYLAIGSTNDNNAIILPIAREPDWNFTEDWSFHKQWWLAKDSVRSKYELKDFANLRNIPSLNGSTAYIIDGADRCGTFHYKEVIKHHNPVKGELLFDTPVGLSIFDSQESGIGPNTLYYVEGKEELLDSPGEWYFNPMKKKLFVWPRDSENSDKLLLELAYRLSGIKINASNIVLDGFILNYFQTGIAIQPDINKKIENVTLKNITIEKSIRGIDISASNPTASIESINIDNSSINYIQENAINIVASSSSSSNISNITIANSSIHHTALAGDYISLNFIRTDGVKLLRNHIYDVGSNAVIFTSYEKNPGVLKNIRVVQNTIEKVCRNVSNCAALKFYGGQYEDTIAEKNVLRDIDGWSYCQEKSSGKGYGNGLFISNASGVTVKNNLSYNNSASAYLVFPRQITTTNNKLLNNLAAYSDIGIELANGTAEQDADKDAKLTRHENTVIKNNILYKNGIGIYADAINVESLFIDYNAYISNKADKKYIGNVLNSWDVHSLKTTESVFKNPANNEFSLPFNSLLRGRGEPETASKFLQFQLNFFGFGNDIGPCRFKWFNNSCNR